MQRKIKFRAWDKKENKMLTYFYMPNEITINKYMECLIIPRRLDKLEDCFHPKIDFELMQFTGLKDKNGKEIYEGDIVVYRDISASGRIRQFPPRMVIWDIDSCGFNISQIDSEAEIEILGNIYEHPHLIKKSKC